MFAWVATPVNLAPRASLTILFKAMLPLDARERTYYYIPMNRLPPIMVPATRNALGAMSQNRSDHVVCRPIPPQKCSETLPNIPGLTYERERNGAE